MVDEELCKSCDPEGSCLLSCLRGEVAEHMRRERVFRDYDRHQIVFYQGDEPTFVFGVISGLVKFVRTGPYQQEVVIRLVGRGEIGGWRPILAEDKCSVTAEVVEPSRLCIFPKSAFLCVMEKSPELRAACLKLLARELRISEDRWFNSVRGTLEERVADVLLQLAETRRRTAQGGDRMRISVPRVDIALAAGITPSTLSRVLRGFSDRGMIRLYPRAIDVVKLNAD